MNADQLTAKYGARYPYTLKPLPACLTADGREFDLGETLWYLTTSPDDNGDDQIRRQWFATDPTKHDLFLEAPGKGLLWVICFTDGSPAFHRPIHQCYSSEQKVIAAEIKALEEQRTQLQRQIDERKYELTRRIDSLRAGT